MRADELRQVVEVSIEFPLDIEDVDGRWIRLDWCGPTIYNVIPASAYARNRWMGLFTRNLQRVRGFGREFLIDVNWQQRQEWEASVRHATLPPPTWVPVAPPNAKRGRCGCDKKT